MIASHHGPDVAFPIAVVIFALILFIVLATMKIPTDKYPALQAKPSAASSPSSSEAVAASLANVQATSDGKLPILSISDISAGHPPSTRPSAETSLPAVQSTVESALSAIASAAAPPGTISQASRVTTAFAMSFSGMATTSRPDSAGAAQSTSGLAAWQGIIATTLGQPVQHTHSPSSASENALPTPTFLWAPIGK